MSSSHTSPNKRLKSEAEDSNDDDNQDYCCGICYVDRGASIQGEIDSCNHYFCFVCIMEWAKHESRCPICRQRFSNVRRLPKLGLFSSSRDVKVPLRDQVYHPFGNTTRGPVDSYAEVKCSICYVGTDENFLLLCDLCDTASHTYCVGLGYTVPESDWFCHDCAVSREINANEELEQQNCEPTADSGVSILNIVRETGSHVVRRPRAIPSQQNHSSSSVIPLPRAIPSQQNHSPSSVIPLPDMVSRTEGKNLVSGVQRARRNVQMLRENWNSFRSGSLRFNCKSFQSGGTSSQKQDSGLLLCGKLDDSHLKASMGHRQSTVQGGQSSNMSNDGNLKYDLDKAWKMMDRAKMAQQTHRRTSKIPPGVDHPSGSGARGISFADRNRPELKSQRPRTLDSRYSRMDKRCDYSSLNRNLEDHRSLVLRGKRQSRVPCEEITQHLRDRTAHSEGYDERPLTRKAHANSHGASCREDGERHVVKEQRQSACLTTSVGSAPSHAKYDSVFTSNKHVDNFNEETRFARSIGDGIMKNIDDAKTEIKSLVKLYLKGLTRDKQLGVETFKVIARQATHTILDACSSKQQKSNIYSASSVCSHTDHILQFQKSNLMPNCCRECFYVYVNNVVKSIMLEKVSCA